MSVKNRSPKASPRQKTVMLKMLRGVHPKQAIVESGYSPNTRINDISKKEGFQQLLDEHLPEDKLIRVHKEGLEATRLVGLQNIEMPDHMTRKQYLELAYRLRGKLNANEGGNTYNFNVFSKDQIKRIAARIVRSGDSIGEGESNQLLNSAES